MQRTQIYLEDNTINELKKIAKNLNISMSEYIRQAIKNELKKYRKNNLEKFLDNLKPLESFRDINPTEYVDNIRNNSRIINE